MLYLLALILVIFRLWIPETFLTHATFKIVLADQVVIGILGLAVLVPLTAGAFDLSCGAMLAFSLVIMSWFQAETGLNAFLSAIIALAACAAVGFLSGHGRRQVPGQLVHRHARHEPGAGRGDAVHLEQPPDRRRVLRELPRLRPARRARHPDRRLLPRRHRVHHLVRDRVHARSAATCWRPAPNPEAARLAGVRTDRMVWGSLVVSAVVSGLAGIIYGAKVGSFSNTFGPPLLFPAFAAVFFGSTQFKNRANVWGTIAAVYTLAFGVKGLQLAFSGGVYWITPLFNGLALLVAVALASRKAIPRLRPKVAEPTASDAPTTRGRAARHRPPREALTRSRPAVRRTPENTTDPAIGTTGRNP